jgi:serine/threonine-protein kinase
VLAVAATSVLVLAATTLWGLRSLEMNVGAGSRATSPVGVKARAASSAPGRLSLRIKPGAEVFLDGKSLGVTPFSAPLEVPPGPRTLVLKNAKLGVARELPISLKPGEQKAIRVNLLEPP